MSNENDTDEWGGLERRRAAPSLDASAIEWRVYVRDCLDAQNRVLDAQNKVLAQIRTDAQAIKGAVDLIHAGKIGAAVLKWLAGIGIAALTIATYFSNHPKG